MSAIDALKKLRGIGSENAAQESQPTAPVSETEKPQINNIFANSHQPVDVNIDEFGIAIESVKNDSPDLPADSGVINPSVDEFGTPI